MLQTPRLRYPLLVAGLLVALYLLLVQDKIALPNRAAMAFWNLAHVPLFFLLTVLFDYSFLKRYPRHWSVWLQFLLPPLIVFAIGTEALQSLTDRQPSWRDVLANSSGIALATLWIGGRRYASSARNRLLRLLVIVVGLLLLVEPLQLIYADRHSKAQFPVLADFENRIDSKNWSLGERTETNARDGRHALQIHFPAHRFAGTTLRYFPADWRPFQQLRLSVFNPGSMSLDLSLRVHDRQHERGEQPYHDRFNFNFSAAPGWTDLVIPLHRIASAPRDRKLDLAQVAALRVFFPGTPPADTKILIDSVRLD